VLGLYVHIPFCASICNYCNFNRGLFDRELKDRYVAALLAEIGEAGDGEAADTIFFGGGTPSMLEPDEIGAIVAALRGHFALTTDAEVTLEANPETMTPSRLAEFRAAGVNRISFGVQSFRDAELSRLGRVHSASRAEEAFAMARQAGCSNVSLDLMMWLPQQSVADWLQSVDSLIRIGPDHASLYLLEIYPNAPLRDAMARGQWSQAPDDDAADMYLEAMSRLEQAGYLQYEISNVAVHGRESRHNLKYWTGGSWLGFGCGAHSTRAGVRWKNTSSTEGYISEVGREGSARGDLQVLVKEERLEEELFMGLRLVKGVDLEAIGLRFDVDVWRRYGADLQPFVEQGLLVYDSPHLRLTRPGMLLANEIMRVFISPAVR
jgi:oxygen-independent coproporphyrinogen III oxidase